MMSSELWTELLINSFQHQIHDLQVAIPCVIVNIRDINQQRVDVQPAVNLVTPSGEYKQNPPILSVPVMFPSTSTSALTLEIQSGDEVLCVFSHRCIDLFKNQGGIVNPIDLRKFDKRDAVAIVGLSSFNKAANNSSRRQLPHNPRDVVLAHNIGTSNEVEIRLKKDGSVAITTSSKITVNANEAEVNAENTTVNGDVEVNGDLSVNGDINCSQTVTASTDVLGGGKSLKTHTHSGVMSGGSNSGPPV